MVQEVQLIFVFLFVFVFKFIFVRPRFGRSWRRPNSRAKSAGCILLATPYDAANFAFNLVFCILYLCFAFVPCICILYLCPVVVIYVFLLYSCDLNLYIFCVSAFVFVDVFYVFVSAIFWHLIQILGGRLGNKGGVTLAAIRIRTFGNICI